MIAVHGGCGPGPRGRGGDDPELHAALAGAVEAGSALLLGGGAALDAVEAAVQALEAFPRFNAGRGSVLTEDGDVEMDAAIMCGRDLHAGAVAAVSRVRHPIAAARAVMEGSPHVLLAGAGAEAFAGRRGLELINPREHVTERQRERWLASRGEDAPAGGAGTVGAVALDRAGDLAAATSTGGRRGQLRGRVGDSPLVGAGTYAENGCCAVSATGDGEEIVRAVAAHEVARLVAYRGLPLAEACETVLRERIAPLGGEAGLIAVGPGGDVAMPFTTGVMSRAVRAGEGAIRTGIGAELVAATGVRASGDG